MKKAIDEGRPLTTSIVPGTSIRHFLCKSKQNVQFTMSTFNVHFSTVLERRKLFSVYSAMHANVHSKNLHPKVEFINARFLTALAWVTPTFELYCVAPPNCNRKSLSNGASRIAQWVQRENERLFIIGGAVSCKTQSHMQGEWLVQYINCYDRFFRVVDVWPVIRAPVFTLRLSIRANTAIVSPKAILWVSPG